MDGQERADYPVNELSNNSKVDAREHVVYGGTFTPSMFFVQEKQKTILKRKNLIFFSLTKYRWR